MDRRSADVIDLTELLKRSLAAKTGKAKPAKDEAEDNEPADEPAPKPARKTTAKKTAAKSTTSAETDSGTTRARKSTAASNSKKAG